MVDWEQLSYIVTVVGLPFALIVFILEQRKNRLNEQEEIYQRLSDEYREFLKLVLGARLNLKSLTSDVRTFSITLAAHRYILSEGHRCCPSNKPGNTSNKNCST